MTTPAGPAFLDVNNPLLAGGPAQLDVGSMDHPQMGKVGLVTIRTSSTTLTLLMDAKNVGQWGDVLKGLAAEMGGGKLQAASITDVAALDSTMQRKTR